MQLYTFASLSFALVSTLLASNMELFLLIIMLHKFVIGKTSYLGAEDYVLKIGYPYEKHMVKTEDNYILEIGRIPYSLQNNSKQNRPPVLLVHGLGSASTDFLLLGAHKALGFQLVDNGYDVWLANCRGLFYTSHTTLKKSSSQFWNYSWHEIGFYDMPVIIDHILNVTNYQQVTFIGHSQGGTACFVMLSEKPKYNNKIKALITYSPAVFVCNSKSSFASLSIMELDGSLTKLREMIGDFNISPFSSLYSQLCKENASTYSLCVSIVQLTADLSPTFIPSENFLSFALKYVRTGVSTKQIVHFLQGFNTCQFRHYRNSINTVPKEYNLNNVRIPIYAFSGSRDKIISTEDVMLLNTKLSNGFIEYYDVPGIAHNDFVLGKYAPKVIYIKTLEIINKLHKN